MTTTTIFGPWTLSGNNTLDGFTIRQCCAPADLASFSGTPTRFRVTFDWGDTCPTTSQGLIAAFGGRSNPGGGNQQDFDGTPAQILFSGTGLAPSSANAQVVSDWVALPQAYDSTKQFMTSFALEAGSALTAALNTPIAHTGTDVYYVSGNSASVISGAAFALYTDQVIASISKIELDDTPFTSVVPVAYGSGTVGTSSTISASPITTLQSNVVVVVDIFSVVLNAGGAIAQVTGTPSGTGITGWTKKQSISNHGGAANSWNNFERWYGFAASPLSAITISATLDRTCDAINIAAIAIANANFSTPFDVNANASKQAQATGFSQPTLSGFSTTNTHCLVLSAVGIPHNDVQTGADIAGVSVGIGYSFFNTKGATNVCYQFSANYATPTTAALTSATCDFTAGGNPNTWCMLVDAIQEVSSIVQATTPSPAVWFDPELFGSAAFDPEINLVGWYDKEFIDPTAGPQVLSPALVTNTQTFPTPTVAPGAVTLTPSLFTNTSTFSVPTVVSRYTLTPALFSNTPQTFFAPTVAPGAINLTPALVTNTSTFSVPTVGRGAVNLTPALFTNTSTFSTPTVSATYSLTPNLFTNTQTFFAPTVAPGAVNLTPALFTNTSTFSTPTVSLGATNLSASLFTNTQNFFAPTVSATYGLAPGLFTNTQTFFPATVAPGAVNLAPALFTNSQSFSTPIVSLGAINVAPALFTNSQTFFAPAVAAGAVNLTPALFTNTSTFSTPTVTTAYSLAPALFTNAQSFFAPTVTSVKTLTPALFTNAQSFFTPTLLSSYGLTPALFTNVQTFPAATVGSSYGLASALVTNTQSFFAETVAAGAVNLSPALFTDPDVFFGGTVALEGAVTVSAIALNNPLIASMGALTVR